MREGGEQRDRELRGRGSGSEKVELEEIGSESARDKDEKLEGEDFKRYRSLSARLAYLSHDRPALLYCAKELMRNMAAPTKEDEAALKRAGRYLVGAMREVAWFPVQAPVDKVVVYADSDYAGCLRARKSTSGGTIFLGDHCLKSWSKTQPVLALSSGEAELAAVVRASTEGIGMQSLMGDIGMEAGLEVKSDATAAIGVVSRQGLGRVRHLAVADLWVQQKALLGEVVYTKVKGLLNPADMMTKGVGPETVRKFMDAMGHFIEGGRHHLAPMAEIGAQRI